jgi:hypothetical protein
MKIIFPQSDDYNNSPISIITPAIEIDISILADKDVPAGKPYLIVEDSALPTDRTYRNAWRCNFDKPHGHGLTKDEFLAKYPKSNLGVVE